MTPAPVLLLAIDDDPQHLELIQAALSQPHLEILTTTSPREGLDLFRTRRPQIVLSDLMMPEMGGLEVLERIMDLDPGADVVIMTAHYSTESAVAAIQQGACDYLNKPVSVEALRQKIDKLVANAQKRLRSLQLDQQVLETYQFHGIVGQSPLMLDVFSKITRVAPHFQTVLVTGATGTGKELVGRALHEESPRAKKPFVVCNCTAIVETLFESELFGHVRGAFTGAVQDKMGMWETAHGGTLMLDEIGDVPLSVQAKLLRALQHQEIQRVGSPAVRRADVRVVAATNRDLRAMVAERRFREDLFYRLSMVEIHLPRLAERKEDVRLLQRFFLERFSHQYLKNVRGFTRRAQALLSRYPWPGNVRELENVVGYACMMTQRELLDLQDLPESMSRVPVTAEDPLGLPLSEVQRRHVRRVLEHVDGNKQQAAAILGIGRSTLYRMLAEGEPGQDESQASAENA